MRKTGINMYLYAKMVLGRIIDINNAAKYWDKDNIDLYLINDSIIDWENCYINKKFRLNIMNNINNINITELIKDAFTFMLFTPRFCRELIQEAENLNDWRISNNDNNPSQDIHLVELDLDKQWDRILQLYISPILIHLYSNHNVKSTHIVFIIKYSMDGQRLLKEHHDTSIYSINITLNQSFTGGGTYFVGQKYLYQDSIVGQAIMHPGKYIHTGAEITSGTRYVLIAFLK